MTLPQAVELRGVVPVIPTPFRADESIDLEGLSACIEFAVRCRVGNTSEVPFSVDVGFGGSRSTNINGHAAIQACGELRKKLLPQAVKMLECAE